MRSHGAAERTDAQLFWIIQNGLHFTGIPGFSEQYSEQDIWSLVTDIRALQDPGRAPLGGGGQRFIAAAVDIAAPTSDQLAGAHPFSDQPVARGEALYFAQGCHLYHGAAGDAPGDLALARGSTQSYATSQLSDAELTDMQAFLATIGSAQRRPER